MNLKLTLSLATIIVASCSFADKTLAIFANLGASMNDVTYRSGHTRPYATLTIDTAKLRTTVASSLGRGVDVSPKQFDEIFAKGLLPSRKDEKRKQINWNDYIEVLDVCELEGKEATRRAVVDTNKSGIAFVSQTVSQSPLLLLVVTDWVKSPESARFALRFKVEKFANEVLKMSISQPFPVYIIHASAPNEDPIWVTVLLRKEDEEEKNFEEERERKRINAKKLCNRLKTMNKMILSRSLCIIRNKSLRFRRTQLRVMLNL